MTVLSINLAIIEQRWPEIYQKIALLNIEDIDAQWIRGMSDTIVFQGIQQSSSYDADMEAKIQCQQVAESQTHIYIYGLGLGHVQQQFLMRQKLAKLTTTILNLSLFLYSLQQVDHSSWLNDSRTHLQLAQVNQQVSFPFIALPGALATVDEAYASLRDRLCLELDQQFITDSHSGSVTSVDNAIKDNSELMLADEDVLAIKLLPALKSKLASSATFVIAAAGPTLSDHYNWLKQHADNIILIVVDAAVKPLLKAEIKPDIIVSIDQIASRLFAGITKECLVIPLVYFPLLDNEFLTQWPGPRFASLSSGKSFDGIAKIFNKTRLYSAGSVIHPSIDLAVKLGAKEILLLGADFALLRHQTHVAQTNVLSDKPVLTAEQTPHWVHNGYGEKVPTYLNFRGYLRDLETYISHHSQVTFFNGSLAGAAIQGARLWPAFDASHTNRVIVVDNE